MEKNDFGNGKLPSDESYLKKENINIHCETRRKTEYQRDDAACKNTREDSYQSSRRIINEIVVELFKNILNIEERALQVRGIKDLTMTAMHAIEAIGIGKGRKMSEVAANLNVTMGTLTATLIKLEKKGYATRTKDVKDKRIVIAGLTKRGELANKIHTNFHDEMIDHLMIDLRPDEDKALIRALKNINDFFLKEYGGIYVN